MPNLKYKTGKDFSEYKEKFLARKAVATALRKGDILKASRCQMCHAEEELQAHHIDYSKPLKVYWLCRPCHSIAHGKYSLLNPHNQRRGPIACVQEKCYATIATSVNFDMFVWIKKIAEENNTTVSSVLRTALISQYNIDNTQTDFIRDDYSKKAEISQPVCSRIQDMVVDEDCMLQQEFGRLQKLRGEGSGYLPGMEQLFQAVC